MTEPTVQALLADQQDRWQRGERVDVESYLARTPALNDSRDDLLDLIYHEILLRERHGESVTFDEYSRRFPVLADELRVQFEVHAGLGDELKRKRLPAIPGCTVVRRIGRGGVGVVYLARQEALGRTVAVKVIREWSTADDADLARFRAEAEAVARVNHPNVVQVYQVGERRGCPYLILEYVAGGSLDRRLRGRPLAARTAAELVGVLARAVDHLHRHAIVHCDLKPANVLLAPADAGGVNLAAGGEPPERFVPKVADFGFARRVDADLASRSGGALGTPQYMAPEQIDGPAHRIAPPTDVHALGAILYELLVGRPPYLGDDVLAVFRQVLQHDPVPPSRLQPGVPRDLETVCLKCLHKDPARRYPSAAALADDLDRFLAGRPVSARPVSAAERAARWAGRNQWVAGLAAALVIAVVVGFTLVTAKWLEARQERNDKEEARKGEKLRADELGVALDDLEAVAHRMRIVAADRELKNGNATAANRILDDCRPTFRSFDWFHLKQLARGSRLTLRTGHRFADRVVVSSDGKRLAVAGGVAKSEGKSATELEQTVCIVDATTGQILRTLSGGKGGLLSPHGLAFSPNGRRLAVAQADKMLRVWDVESGEVVWSHPNDRGYFDLAFPSDTEVLTAGERWVDPQTPTEKFRVVAEFQVWDAAIGRVTRTVAGPPLTGTNYGTLSRDGRRFVAWSSFASDSSSVKPVPLCVCDVTTGALVAEFAGHTSQVQTVALSPDGNLVAVADRHLIRVHAADGLLRGVIRPPSRVYTLAFSSDGRSLATAGEDRTIRVWDVGTGLESAAFRGHDDAVSCVRFLPGGGMVSSGHDGTARIWDAAPPGITVHRDRDVFAVAASSTGRVLAASHLGTKTVRLFGRDPGRVIETFASGLALSPDGTTLATANYYRGLRLQAGTCGVRVWEVGSGQEARFLPDVVGPLAFTADGRSVVGIRARTVNQSPVNPDGDVVRRDVVVCNRSSGEELYSLAGHTSDVRSVVAHPDGKRLITAGHDEVIVWDLQTRGKVIRIPVSNKWTLEAMAVRPDGKQLATAGSNDQSVVVRDPDTGAERYTIALTANANSLAYSSDSRLLAAGCDDGTVRLWDADSGQFLLTLTDARQPVRSLAFGGNRLLIAGGQGIGSPGDVIVWSGGTD